MVSSVMRGRIAEASCVYVSPSEQLQSCLLTNVSTFSKPGFLWSFEWYLMENETCHSITVEAQWLIYLPIASGLFQSYWITHTAVWVSPELQLPVPKEVLAETEDLSGECAVAENALMYPKMDMTAPVNALFHYTILGFLSFGLHILVNVGKWQKVTTCIPRWLFDTKQFELDLPFRHALSSVNVLVIKQYMSASCLKKGLE